MNRSHRLLFRIGLLLMLAMTAPACPYQEAPATGAPQAPAERTPEIDAGVARSGAMVLIGGLLILEDRRRRRRRQPRGL